VPVKRTYADHGDACATAHAIELVGDRWNYPVLRELMLAPKRFGELLLSVRGITPAVLTSRLRQLERAGLLQRIIVPAPARVPAYELTEWGLALDPIMQALGRWGHLSPTRVVEGCGLTPDATIQSMRTMASPKSPHPPIELTLHLFDGRLPTDPGYDYTIAWTESGLTAGRGTNPLGQAHVYADSSTWARVLYDGFPLNNEQVHVEGDHDLVQRLVSQFASIQSSPSSEHHTNTLATP